MSTSAVPSVPRFSTPKLGMREFRMRTVSSPEYDSYRHGMPKSLSTSSSICTLSNRMFVAKPSSPVFTSWESMRM
jgi:hypothetical protein